MSGYTYCACQDCFDIAISGDEINWALCGDCEAAGCDGESDCCRGCDESEETDVH